MTERSQPLQEVRCAHCDRPIECCWVCEDAGCEHPACYRCVRDALGEPTDPIGAPFRSSG